MKTFLVTYETSISESLLVTRLQTFQLWARPLKNTWLIKSDADRNQVMNYLLTGLLYFSGKILVIEVTNDWVAKNLSTDVVQWMQGGL